MTIYIVNGDNGLSYEDYDHWVECVFSSRESAEKYIEERDERGRFISKRIYELDEMTHNRPLTDEEGEELDRLFSEDADMPVSMWIEERELRD